MVVWITGLADSGKTTLCEALFKQLKPHFPQLVALDGDVVRAVLGDGLGYREADRRVHIGRMGRLADSLSRQGLPSW